MTNTKKVYYAHSEKDLPHEQWQTFSSHAENVAKLAAQFAEIFNAYQLAYNTGLLHDLGKYTPAFDKRLHGGPSVDHATAGAKIAIERWGFPLGKISAFCIASHHTGLVNGDGEGDNRSTLKQRLSVPFGKGNLPELDPIWQSELPLPEKLVSPDLTPDPYNPSFSLAFFIRMLYSCLVDADFLDTEAFYANLKQQDIDRGNAPSLDQLHQQFNWFISDFRERKKVLQPQTEEEQRNAKLNRLRSQILDHAVEQAQQEPGLFSLTVPTGGGKTFTSMAFALEHAKKYGMQRIIYVIPFTSIIEQNAQEFRKAFGEFGEAAVLEHHSTFDDEKLLDKDTKDKLKLASENWDMPIVVTTAVQFFESLFADKSSRCRKLHNIANSVIILDEAQMLPLNLLLPIMQSIKELARNYHSSIVMCTATQPAIQAQHGFYCGFENVREIAPNPTALFADLRRTSVQHIGMQSDKDLIEKLTENQQILIIVNNRRHARSLYEQAKQLDGTFHLTTLMCAKHRSQMLEQIRQHLQAGRSCRVIATSLIEAGVDVDFPLVMRAEAGLDSVAQAAGRCNREGKKLAEQSFVWVFQPEQQWKVPPELSLYSAVMRSTVRRYSKDLLSVEAINHYFSGVYEQKGKDLDNKQILEKCHAAGKTLDFPFQTIAKEFRMIESHMLPLIIPFDKEAEKRIEELRYAEKVGGLLRKLQPYTVQIPKESLEALFKAGRIEAINEKQFGNQFYSLIGLDLYDEVAGLDWEDLGFIKVEGMVF
ncbi:CRISPR-associated helicase Cas3' [Basfia succiniciproducens]|uniref:CRISPR-associated helicase, Cas3 family n=1 Tax=Basfia succiniciproducens TaxID=653940 RepID=A0A1G5BKG8_9PAST|nr:CRISPR-associated helicase Cas3' [Basfia succiniciproducens]QIM68376.1 CRISPR-associated helicase/endonuclease Cas3 [Basfia succiniciproducens]SCX90607.1 CRISPR-associated helicase, Cas3 family [Basfia succiniciproducens]